MTQLTFYIRPEWNGKSAWYLMKYIFRFSAGLIKKIKNLPDALSRNNLIIRHYDLLYSNDIFSVILPNDPPSNIVPAHGPLSIIYEDTHLIILNKDAGVPVHPGPNHHYDTVGNYITQHYIEQGEAYLYRPMNRLDSGTSGLMCIAKHAYAAELLQQQFHSEFFGRTYLAVCDGEIPNENGCIKVPIGRKNDSIIERVVRSDGASAITEYRVLKRVKNRTLIEINLKTGRTHQIRVHMSWLGFPLSGDFLYGKENNDMINRPALHSWKIKIQHPITQENLEFTAPLPEDILSLL